MGRLYIYLQIPTFTIKNEAHIPVPWRVWDLMYPKTPGFELEVDHYALTPLSLLFFDATKLHGTTTLSEKN